MSMKKNLKYLLLLSLLSFMACNGDEKIDLGMVQQDGEVLQLTLRVGDLLSTDVSSTVLRIAEVRVLSKMVIVSASLCWMQIIMYYPTTYLIDMMVTFGASTAITMKEKQPFTTTIKPPFTLPTFRIVRKRIT